MAMNTLIFVLQVKRVIMGPDKTQLNLPTEILLIGDVFIITDKGEINKEHFENWLADDDRLEWCEDWSEAGEHKQRTGTFDMEEYYDSRYVLLDVIDYIYKLRNGKLYSSINMAASLKKLMQ